MNSDYGAGWVLAGLIIFIALIIAAFLHSNKKAKDNLGDKITDEAQNVSPSKSEYKTRR